MNHFTLGNGVCQLRRCQPLRLSIVAKRAAPPQSPYPKPLLDLVGYGIQLALLLPLLPVEEHPVDQARVVQAAVEGTEEEQRAAFRRVRDEIGARLREWLHTLEKDDNQG
jgi:hypothetical protein